MGTVTDDQRRPRDALEARQASVEGIVQGVGFRPWVARLAIELGVCGSVSNENARVRIHAEGGEHTLNLFARRLLRAEPPIRIGSVHWQPVPVSGSATFEITESLASGPRQLTLPPDLGVCPACLAEVRAEGSRRHGYPFTNCAQCGPRFTIVKQLPYDRPNTTMAAFVACAQCQREYGDVSDRRFHAQPIACPSCGPELRLVSSGGDALVEPPDAIETSAVLLRRGNIVGLKGLGGFQLLSSATSPAAVGRLRERKRRWSKPLAVLVRDLAQARQLADLSSTEESALRSAAAPIVLVKRRASSALATDIAPGLARVGLMLPTTPLHDLLIRAHGGPLVCTSGNVSDEPLAFENAEAVARLREIADAFLLHDRPIARRVDDAVVQVLDGKTRTVRLGRGLGPRSFRLPVQVPPFVCLGSHLSNAPAAAAHGDVVMWPHVGDLESLLARQALDLSLSELNDFLGIRPEFLVTDAHPDYASTRWAERSGIPVRPVFHHHAHVAACLAEHGCDRALGVAWDGAGLGPDGGLWGGEFLRVTPGGADRVAHLRPFPLLGGARAARDGRRPLAGLCLRAGVARAWDVDEFNWRRVIMRGAVPHTTSVGRLFDAVAAWTGVCPRSRYTGQAAAMLESMATDPDAPPYTIRFSGARPLQFDWRPMLREIAKEIDVPGRVASRFHATLRDVIVEVAAQIGEPVVALSGGCFQNQVLSNAVCAALRGRGFVVLLPEQVPTHDGGLALGQAWIAAHDDGRHRSRGGPCA